MPRKHVAFFKSEVPEAQAGDHLQVVTSLVGTDAPSAGGSGSDVYVTGTLVRGANVGTSILFSFPPCFVSVTVSLTLLIAHASSDMASRAHPCSSVLIRAFLNCGFAVTVAAGPGVGASAGGAYVDVAMGSAERRHGGGAAGAGEPSLADAQQRTRNTGGGGIVRGERKGSMLLGFDDEGTSA